MNHIELKDYDINNYENLNFYIEEDSNVFVLKYFIIINEYIGLYLENVYDNISINIKKDYRFYIIIKGLELLSNIINVLLIYTNNLDLIVFHCHKSYYYYIEFITQLDIENNQLELSIKDGIIFVYKKTIFGLKENISKINNASITPDNIKKIDNIEKIVSIINKSIQIFIIKDILNLNIGKNYKDLCLNNNITKILNKISKNFTNEYEYNIFLNKIDELLNSILKIINKTNIINNKEYDINNIINFEYLHMLIDRIINKLVIISMENLEKINFNLIISENLLYNLNVNQIRHVVNSF